MIIPLSILLYRLFVRFPVLLLLVYCLQFFSKATVNEIKTEDKTEEVEYSKVELLTNNNFNNHQEPKPKKSVSLNWVHSFDRYEIISSGFVKSAYYKLYILYCSLSIEKRVLGEYN